MTSVSSEPFRSDHIAPFLLLARQEQWVVDWWEPRFLLDAFPQGCRCLKNEQGQPQAFVTALKHGTSGWIGNLIVAPEARGRGKGEGLFLAAWQALRDAGTETVWLTASSMGRELYARHGFRTVDTIQRWVGDPRKGVAPAVERSELEELCCLDAAAWGDDRTVLLEALASRGRLVAAAEGRALLQGGGQYTQVGPCLARDAASAAALLEACLTAAGDWRPHRVCIDAPADNPGVERIFSSLGLRQCGSSELMYAGAVPGYRPELLYGLATMGSCG